MRQVFDVEMGYPGAEPVFESHGMFAETEDVEIVSGPGGFADPVYFVDMGYPGAKPVRVVAGMTRREESLQLQLEEHERSMRMRRAVAPEFEGPPDARLLDDDQSALQGALNAAWDRVRATGGSDVDSLIAASRLAALGLTMPWPDARWVENLLMMGGNSAVTLWRLTRDHDLASEVLPLFADAIAQLDWQQGGPSNQFEAHEAAAVLAAAAEL